MARTKPTLPAHNSLVASAARMGGQNLLNLSRPKTGASWHQQAWEFYHIVGEFRYACDWKGAMLSKTIMFAQHKVNGVYEKVEAGDAFDYMEQLFRDDEGKAEALRLMGIHMEVTGEFFIVAYENPDRFGEAEVWEIVASTKLVRPTTEDEKDHYRINGRELMVDQSKVLCIRVWRPDPEDPEQSISPARAVLPILGEIVRLTDHVAAQVDSRLAGAGILLMPSEMTFPTPPVEEGTVQMTANNADQLMQIISTAMATAIRDRSNPSALVPIVITAPSDVIDKIKHVTFWSDLSEQAMELRKEAIGRLALGMDIPPEVLQGVAESNHWSAWQADESAIKAHTEPLLKLITSALTQKYLRPLLAADDGADVLDDEEATRTPVPDEELRDWSIGVDTSEMRLRPNRSKEALELYNLGELSGTALRRETNFDEEDKMDDDELARWHIRKVAQGSTTPELVEAALEQVGVKLNVAPSTSPGTEGRPAPSLDGHPQQSIPDRVRSETRKIAREQGNVPSADPARRAAGPEDTNRLAAAVAVGSEQAVFRALERAGNRMRNKMGGKLAGISAGETYLTFGTQASDLDYYLDDAWGENVRTLADRTGVSHEKLKSALDGYCRVLLVSQRPHTFKALESHLTMALREEVMA